MHDNISTVEALPLRCAEERARRHFVAESPAMQTLVGLATRIAPTTLAVVLHGETGSGKEVVARFIHLQSRRPGNLVAFNCAAVPTTLAESELFGHVRGAFTGADATRAGLFEQADQGTLFLDEVGELDLAVQAKLLRVIEDGIVRPVGGTLMRSVDVRLITASHRDLAELVEQGKFREDLYHRIAGLMLPVPPLRARLEDIVPLTFRFLREAAPERRPHVALDAWEWLKSQSWPGNVRELRQTVLRAAALGGDQLTVEDFTLLAPRRIGEDKPLDSWFVGKGWQQLEVEIIRSALQRHGTVRAAARALGRPPSTLADRVKRLGIVMSARP